MSVEYLLFPKLKKCCQSTQKFGTSLIFPQVPSEKIYDIVFIIYDVVHCANWFK